MYYNLLIEVGFGSRNTTHIRWFLVSEFHAFITEHPHTYFFLFRLVEINPDTMRNLSPRDVQFLVNGDIVILGFEDLDCLGCIP